MDKNLDGKVVIVTGAGGGIGRAASIVLAKAGARLIISDVIEDAAETTRAAVEEVGAQAKVVMAELTSPASVESMVEQTISAFGRLDGAFNNAGIEGAMLPLADMSPADWDRVIGVNLTSMFLCIKYQIPAMLANGGGSIVMTSSALGEMAMPNTGGYVASKHGVIGLMRAAAVDYGDRGIRVNVVMPGLVRTPMNARLSEDPALAAMFEYNRLRHPLKRFAEPSEIGEAVRWLLSDASSFVHGTAMAVDGGFLAA